MAGISGVPHPFDGEDRVARRPADPAGSGTGAQPEPVAVEPDVPRLIVRMHLPVPIGLQDDVMVGLRHLLERLCAGLARHRLGAHRQRLELRRVNQAIAQVEIGFVRPMRDPDRIAAQFARRLEGINSGFGIDALHLPAPMTKTLVPEQIAEQISSVEGAGQDDLRADLLSLIGNRIGSDRAQRLLDQPDPETQLAAGTGCIFGRRAGLGSR